MKDGTAIFLFKPDSANYTISGRKREYPLQEVVVGMMVSAGLELVDHTTTSLESAAVREIYANALRPNPEEDAIYGTQWKQDVVDHMCLAPVDAYLLDDAANMAEYKAKLIKNHLRKVLVGPNNVVQNIAHVPDEDEFPIVRSILFTHE